MPTDFDDKAFLDTYTPIFQEAFRDSGKSESEFLDLLDNLINALSLPSFQGFHLDSHEGTITQIKWILSEIASPESKYTHSDIYALCICLEQCLSAFPYSEGDKIQGMIHGLKSYGINHKTRKTIAKLTLELIERFESQKQQQSLNSIPF